MSGFSDARRCSAFWEPCEHSERNSKDDCRGQKMAPRGVNGSPHAVGQRFEKRVSPMASIGPRDLDVADG
jgi:hypothetical protein